MQTGSAPAPYRTPDDRRPAPERIDHLAMLGVRFRLVVLSGYTDAEHEEGDPVTFCVEATGRDGRTVRAVRMSSEEALLAVLGMERLVRCAKCKEEKPPGEFSRNGSIGRGRVYRCKACERKRVAEYQRRRRAGRAAQAE